VSAAHDAARATAGALAGAAGLNAALHWSPELLEAEARRADALPGAASRPLYGMPVAVKDNIVTVEQPTTCASRILDGYVSPFDATVVERLRAAGGMVACKSNLDEFAMGSSTEHSAFGRVRHPLDPERIPGGSSGGSAALVAAGVVPAALGSETGGSVRQPASFCGIVGIKPTYGRVSRHGLVAFGSSLDAVAPFGRTVLDAARLLNAISGPDPRDSTTLAQPAVALPIQPRSLEGLRVGLPREYFPDDLHRGVAAGVARARSALEAVGATLVDVSLPHTRYAVPAYYVVAPAEASANLARFDGVRYGLRENGAGGDMRALYRATRGKGFGAEVRRRILVGTYVLSAGYYDAYYVKAQRVRSLIADDLQRIFSNGIDVLLAPTSPTPAFKAGEKTSDPVAMYLADVFVCPANLAGIPAVSVPAGRSDGLPVGVQLMAPLGADERMLEVALALESQLDPMVEVR
jgi:aspartyl-tRNA(Asn)/glutamyl-tRNA(Gln) amidotransferase subunit A